jgi:hypothetical protein
VADGPILAPAQAEDPTADSGQVTYKWLGRALCVLVGLVTVGAVASWWELRHAAPIGRPLPDLNSVTLN